MYYHYHNIWWIKNDKIKVFNTIDKIDMVRCQLEEKMTKRNYKYQFWTFIDCQQSWQVLLYQRMLSFYF